MTKEEFEQRNYELDKKIKSISEERMVLNKEYISSLPFKDFEKVTVIQNEFVFDNNTYKEKRTDVFIGSIRIKYGRIDYDFRKIKKDGTVSGQSAGIYSFDKIEKTEL